MLQWMWLVVMGLVLGWEHTAGTVESFTYISDHFQWNFWSPHPYAVEESENLLPLSLHGQAWEDPGNEFEHNLGLWFCLSACMIYLSGNLACLCQADSKADQWELQ